MISAPPIPSSPRLLDQLREVLRYRHYSARTEQAYVYWVRFFIRWHGRQGPLRHPRDMGADEVRAFLSMLATQREVAVSTHNQALSALLFLYREVLQVNLGWLDDIQRPVRPRRMPCVLTRSEVAALLAGIGGATGLLARLLYGTGLRLSEGLGLRVMDIDFEGDIIVVRQGKGGKDRAVMLPHSLVRPLRTQSSAGPLPSRTAPPRGAANKVSVGASQSGGCADPVGARSAMRRGGRAGPAITRRK